MRKPLELASQSIPKGFFELSYCSVVVWRFVDAKRRKLVGVPNTSARTQTQYKSAWDNTIRLTECNYADSIWLAFFTFFFIHRTMGMCAWKQDDVMLVLWRYVCVCVMQIFILNHLNVTEAEGIGKHLKNHRYSFVPLLCFPFLILHVYKCKRINFFSALILRENLFHRSAFSIDDNEPQIKKFQEKQIMRLK